MFALLLYYYTIQQFTCNLVITATSYGRTSLNIKATAQKHSDTMPYLLVAHVLSSCDTVAYLWGIGKVTVVKVLSSGKQPRKLGDLHIQMVDVIPECTLFVAVWYGTLGSSDMTSLRYTVSLSKMYKPKWNSAPDLNAIPPKIDAFVEYVYRAHLQTAI